MRQPFYFLSMACEKDTLRLVDAAGSAFIISDGAHILPRAIVAKARAYLAGAASDVLEVGVRTEGLQQVLMKIQAGDENVDSMTKIKRIMKALKDWKSLLPTNLPLAYMNMKLFGQEIAFAKIDKALIESVIEQAAQMQTGIDRQYSKSLLPAELCRILPTAVGLPMELRHYAAAVAVVSINVHTTITPPLHEQSEPITLDQLMMTNLQLHAEARPRFGTMAMARNIEDLPVQRVVSLAPPVPSDVQPRISLVEGESSEETAFLLKLRGILKAGMKNIEFSSMSSSSSISNNFSSSRGSRSSSSSSSIRTSDVSL
ncbi:vitellogenin-like [Electrophorus electricus]|uniref:vitellogenin-like n=1 Tax=Electrophorus electricus TaxID=8005 RepID=UPI0015D03E5F|nr:vitellogenin-like [Electrophorus electricus]